MTKQTAFNRHTGTFTNEISQLYIHPSGLKGQVRSRTLSEGKAYFAATGAVGNTFKTFAAADGFMRRSGFARVSDAL